MVVKTTCGKKILENIQNRSNCKSYLNFKKCMLTINYQHNFRVTREWITDGLGLRGIYLFIFLYYTLAD
jgi:hypothetical protein